MKYNNWLQEQSLRSLDAFSITPFGLHSQIRETALYKLDALNAALNLDDLRSPPGNRLEALRGDYSGKHSIRINGQWRIVFRWQGSNAHDVEIVDYH